MLHTKLSITQRIKPINVGTRKEIRVHLMLFVSFFIVRSVVEQGQCRTENTMKFMAVKTVQPLSVSILPISARDSVSVRVPLHIYAIRIMGRTISLAGRPIINAPSITPSSPIRRPTGSRKSVKYDRSVTPPISVLARSHITVPTGRATEAARPNTDKVFSRNERTITFIKAGLRYGGSSITKEDFSVLSKVFESSFDTPKVAKIPRNTTAVRITADITELPKPTVVPMKNRVISVIIAGYLPLQGAKVLVIIAIRRSFGESIILVPVTPAALQPKPIHIVRAHFPQEPHFLKVLSRLYAIRGRSPESSSRENKGKNTAIGGSITETTQPRTRNPPSISSPVRKSGTLMLLKSSISH